MKRLNYQKGISPIIVVVLLAVILIGGAYYFKQQTKQVSKSNIEVDETANWKTYANTLPGFTIKYPPTWYVGSLIVLPPSEGSGTQEFLADSKATMGGWVDGNYSGDKAKISNNQILIPLGRYVYRTEPLLTDPQGHTNDELLQKVVNSAFGTESYGVVAKGTPWVNLGEESSLDENGFINNFTFSTVKFTKTTIDGHLAARLINNNAVFYIILVNSQGQDSLKISAQPSNSIYISTFDQIISTLKFTNPNQTISQADIDAIKQALLSVVKTTKENLTFDIDTNLANQYGGMFASGHAGAKDAAGGGVWIAAKVNGAWQIVSSGNGIPVCAELNPYNVPSAFSKICVDANGKIVNR